MKRRLEPRKQVTAFRLDHQLGLLRRRLLSCTSWLLSRLGPGDAVLMDGALVVLGLANLDEAIVTQ